MKYLGEKESESFLEKEGFPIVQRSFSSTKGGVKKAISKIGVPFVMKVSGNKIVHKNKVKGIELDVTTYSEALRKFFKLKKIKGSNGVVFQSKLQGKEFLIGVLNTPEFGQVIGFGSGGIDTEKQKDVSFRVAPLDRGEICKMIKETKSSIALLKKDGKVIENIILKISNLVEKYPKIKELDINPLIVQDGIGTIVDTRIVFE
ncbi:MAG: acetate--CoA ligase family protein [Nanoarchaeota archaeon]|nr:acetate--CoA ligase family protein [Nanoarchaeota archaeon]